MNTVNSCRTQDVQELIKRWYRYGHNSDRIGFNTKELTDFITTSERQNKWKNLKDIYLSQQVNKYVREYLCQYGEVERIKHGIYRLTPNSRTQYGLDYNQRTTLRTL